MMETKISIIVPVYKVEKYLTECLESLINQTYKNLEIICINDGSPDTCGVILDDYAKRDERIYVVTQVNKGLSSARNTGLNYAHGKYIMFVDSDDWIENDTCERALLTAENNNADVVLWSYVREYDEHAQKKEMPWNCDRVFKKEEVHSLLHRRICGLLAEELRRPDLDNAIVTAWGKLYRSSLIIDHCVRFVDTKEIGTEDALFNLYVFGHVQKAVYINECFNHYRKTNNDSLTKQYNPFLFERWQNLFKRMEAYIYDNGNDLDFSRALINRITLSILDLGLNVLASSKSYSEKIIEIKEILNSSVYRMASKQVELKWLPLHWKLFYYSAKHEYATGVFIFLRIIRGIIARA